MRTMIKMRQRLTVALIGLLLVSIGFFIGQQTRYDAESGGKSIQADGLADAEIKSRALDKQLASQIAENYTGALRNGGQSGLPFTCDEASLKKWIGDRLTLPLPDPYNTDCNLLKIVRTGVADIKIYLSPSTGAIKVVSSFEGDMTEYYTDETCRVRSRSGWIRESESENIFGQNPVVDDWELICVLDNVNIQTSVVPQRLKTCPCRNPFELPV